MKRSFAPGVFLFAVSPLFLAGCGSGKGGGSVSALNLPDHIEITKVGGSGSSARPRSTVAGLFSDAGTDYDLEETQSHGEDDQVLDMVNDILEAVGDTAYQEFLNQGPYKALVRRVGGQESQGGSSATSTTVESLMEVIADVTRADNSSPMIVKVWVDDSDGDSAKRIRGYFIVSRGVSAQYPYGKMEAHFKGVLLDDDGNEGAEVMQLAIKVDAAGGNVVVQCVQDESHGGQDRSARLRVQTNSTITAGNAYSRVSETGNPTETQYFAFNEDFFKYADTPGGTPTVLDKNSLFQGVWRYKLFDAGTGALVTMNSGFPIQVLPGGPNGYIGYYGLWVPMGSNVANGATVRRLDNQSDYTLVKVGGKLTRHVKATTTLGDLAGVELSKFACTGGNCTDTVVAWDGSQFLAIGERSQENGQVTYYDLAGQTPVTFQSWEGGWCSALNAYLPLGTISSPADSSVVTYHSESTIDPSDSGNPLPADLFYWGYGFDFSSEPGDYVALQAAEQAYFGSSPSQKHYLFDPDTLTLLDGATVMIASGWNLAGTPYSNGFSIGPLVTDAGIGASAAWDEDVYYYWSTGPNNWSQFAALSSGGNYVRFDPPLQFNYTHHTASDLNGVSTYDGKPFRLSYDGFSLQVPSVFDADRNRWIPILNLIDGTHLNDGSTDYVVKASEVGIFMDEASDPSLAAGLAIIAIDEPDLQYNAALTARVGAVPADVLLKVIKGEVLDTGQ